MIFSYILMNITKYLIGLIHPIYGYSVDVIEIPLETLPLQVN